MDLSNLLSLLYEAADISPPMTACYRDWTKPVAPRVLTAEFDPSTPIGLRWPRGGPFPAADLVTRHLWQDNSERLRVEISRRGSPTFVGVRDKERWWALNEAGDEQTGGQESLPPALRPIVTAPHQILATMRLDVVGGGERMGRRVVCVKAIPRDEGSETTVVDFEFDSEYGTVLRRSVFEEGACTNVTEATRITFGALDEPDCFRFGTRLARHSAPEKAFDQADLRVVAPAVQDHPADQSPVNSPAQTIWLTGGSQDRVRSIATQVERLLLQTGHRCSVLDAELIAAHDDERTTTEHIAELAVFLARSGVAPIVPAGLVEETIPGHVREMHSRSGVRLREVRLIAQSQVTSSSASPDGRSGEGPEPRIEQRKPLDSEETNATLELTDASHIHPRFVALRILDAM